MFLVLCLKVKKEKQQIRELNELGKKESLSWQPRSIGAADDIDGDEDDDDDLMDDVPRGPGVVQGGLNLLQQRQMDGQRRQFIGGAD